MVERPRRAFEQGHKPKFLVVIDDSRECGRAVRFAARRAVRLDGGLVMLSVIDVEQFDQWLSVGDYMKREAIEQAERLMDQYERDIAGLGTIPIDRVIRSGAPLEEIVRLIDEDEDIAYLTLAAGAGLDGPGPLVSMLGRRTAQSFQIPAIVVPGALTDAQIDALT